MRTIETADETVMPYGDEPFAAMQAALMDVDLMVESALDNESGLILQGLDAARALLRWRHFEIARKRWIESEEFLLLQQQSSYAIAVLHGDDVA